jgi:hypothetical protein
MTVTFYVRTTKLCGFLCERFELLMDVNINIKFLCVVASCNLVDKYQHFAGIFETLVHIHQTTRCHNSEDYI